MTIESTDIWYPRLRIQALTTKGPEPMEAEEVLPPGCFKRDRVDPVDLVDLVENCQVKKVLGRIDKDGDGKMNFKDQKRRADWD